MIFAEHRVWGTLELQRVCVVFDRDGLWTRVLRRYLPTQVRVERQQQLPAAVRWEDPQAKPAPWISVVVVERSWGESDGGTWARWRASAPDMLMIAVVPAEDDLAFLWATVLGAQAVFQQLEQAPRLARCVARFWDRIPVPALGDHERIWNNLPWKPQEIL